MILNPYPIHYQGLILESQTLLVRDSWKFLYMNSRSKSWVFTDFTLKKFEEKEFENDFQYLCYGVEICPRTQRKHHQGFLQSHQKKTLRSIKRLLGLRQVHLEKMRGTPAQAILYAKKEGDFHEWGVVTSQGQRSDINALKTLIDEGANESTLAETNFRLFCQYGRGLQRYSRLRRESQSRDFRFVSVILLTGLTGTGKTRFGSRYASFTIRGSDLAWWDGYEGQRCILIDEYANDVRITKLLGLLDGYQLRLAVKGDFTYAQWTTVFISTNLATLHAEARPVHQAALARRISLTLNFPLC